MLYSLLIIQFSLWSVNVCEFVHAHTSMHTLVNVCKFPICLLDILPRPNFSDQVASLVCISLVWSCPYNISQSPPILKTLLCPT